MLLVTGTFRIRPEKLAEARPAMEAMILASRAEDGCLAYAYAEDILLPGLIRVTEAWSERTVLDAHFASEHIRAWRATWAGLEITDRDLTLYEAGKAVPI